MDYTSRSDMRTPRLRWPLPVRVLLACAIGVMVSCLGYWADGHRQTANAAFRAMMEDDRLQIRTMQTIAEVVLVSVLCVPRVLRVKGDGRLGETCRSHAMPDLWMHPVGPHRTPLPGVRGSDLNSEGPKPSG